MGLYNVYACYLTKLFALFLVNDMQTPPLLPAFLPQKYLNWVFGRQKQFSEFLGYQVPDSFGLNLPIQLVIRYHCLAFLNQVRKNQVLKSQKLKMKILLNEKCWKFLFAYVSEDCISFGTKRKFSHFFLF